ncbi:PREDICTED: ADP-ribosylation factor 2-like, partial [Rhagoletis zephyria]|uniref:ADP-ribosylation factor 2-like n=1 Tax=Rhagoletis zephyria TaxID=28612 RepID=UPI0008116C79
PISPIGTLVRCNSSEESFLYGFNHGICQNTEKDADNSTVGFGPQLKNENQDLWLVKKNSSSSSTLSSKPITVFYNLYYDLGFHMETIFYREVSFTILELSGRPASRPTWRQYFSLKQAIIFVVDASDHVRIREAQVELHRMIASSEEEYSKLPIFIVGTKMDLPNSLDELTFMEMMKLHRIPATRNWHFQMVNLMTERNVYECLDWLMAQLKKDK